MEEALGGRTEGVAGIAGLDCQRLGVCPASMMASVMLFRGSMGHRVRLAAFDGVPEIGSGNAFLVREA